MTFSDYMSLRFQNTSHYILLVFNTTFLVYYSPQNIQI